MLISVYLILVVIWVLLLYLASVVGFETPSERRQREELLAFVDVHRVSYCRREKIPPQHCRKAFNESEAENHAINDWIRYKTSADSNKDKSKPWWYAIFGIFVGPFE
jgi:hypothetical protein